MSRFIYALKLSIVSVGLAAIGAASRTQAAAATSETRKTHGRHNARCAHAGCSNTASKSGDTKYCEAHSGKCRSCGCLIDEGTSWCAACLRNALG